MERHVKLTPGADVLIKGIDMSIRCIKFCIHRVIMLSVLLSAVSVFHLAQSFGQASSVISPQKLAKTQLREMAESLNRLKATSLDLVKECHRDVEAYEGGEIDFEGIDDYPINLKQAGQFLPPRKKYVNLHMQQLQSIIQIIEDEITSLSMPEGEQTEAGPEIVQIRAALDQVQKYYTSLKPLTGGPEYNNLAIAKLAASLHEIAAEMQKYRRRIYEMIKDEPKKLSLFSLANRSYNNARARHD